MLLDEIGKSFLDRAVELVKSGYRFVFVLDNIDWEEKVHDMWKDNQNTSVHAVATSIVFNRIPNEDLPDSEPQQDLKKCNVNQLVKVTASEMECIRKRYRSFVQDILFEQFPFFNSFKSSLPNNATYCRYSDEMATKSETITMSVLMKDEKKYAECVDVLDKLEEWTHQIYSAAGLYQSSGSTLHSIPATSQFASSNHTSQPAISDPIIDMSQPTSSASILASSQPALQQHSRPDQPASHIPPTTSDEDPLRGVRVPCFGDQLTRVRLAGAKDLRAGCHTARQRLDHLYPFCMVDWHTKRSYLKVNCL